MLSKIKAILLIIFLFAIGTKAYYAQNFTNYNWYLGNGSQALIFNKSDSTPSLYNFQATPFGGAGASTASEPITGDLMFYSDGENIYDASHQIMDNGSFPNLQGNPAANQSCVIVPDLSTTDQYFLFVNSASGNIQGDILQNVIDMSANGNATDGPPLGSVTAKNVNNGISSGSEAMIVIPNDDYSTYWLLVQFDNTTYHVYSIDNTGLNILPQSFDLTSQGAGTFTASHFAFNGTDKIAVTPYDTAQNIEILDFDINTGILSFDATVFNSFNTDDQLPAIYDAEWSPDGSKLFFSRVGSSGIDGNIYVYDVANPINSINTLLTSNVFNSGGLQLAPDGNIYHLYQATNGGDFQLGRVTDLDSVQSRYEELTNNPSDTIFAGQNFNGIQFPAFLDYQPFITGTFTHVNPCQNSGAIFFPDFSTQPDFIDWDFGDGNTSSEYSPIHTYSNSGNFSVTMTYGFGDSTSSFTSSITVIANSTQVNLGNDTIICPGETLTLDAGSSGSPTWSTGETTQTITVNEAGTYWVAIDNAGCKAYDAIAVEIYDEPVQIGNIWYFGTNAGIDFNTQPPTALVDGNSIVSPEGTSTMSDRNGDLLFYTDGETIYNKEHNIMVGGENIGGENGSSQSAIITEIPEDETRYYVFTTEEVFGQNTYELSYTIVDIKEDQARGEVDINGKDKLLFRNSTERITATVGSSGGWLLAHEYGNNTFRAYPISVDGIGQPTLSSIGNWYDKNTAIEGQGYIKFSPSGNMVAVAHATDNTNLVELFQFDQGTGELSDYVELDLGDAPSQGQVYGIEFSPDNTKLYASLKSSTGNSKVYQYEVDTLNADSTFDTTAIINSQREIASENIEIGALQLGSDSQIYGAVNGSSSLGAVTNPNSDQAGFVINSFSLGGRTSTLGLPNFTQNIFTSPGQSAMSVSNACVDDSVSFVASPTSSIDEFQWFFGDGSGSAIQNPTYVYDTVGSYDVTLRLFNRCGLDTSLTETVTIASEPVLSSNFPQVTSICSGGVSVNAVDDDTGLSFAWTRNQALLSNETSNTITLDQQAIYEVTVTDAVNGCQTTGEIFVADAGPSIDLGTDQTLCTDDTLTLTAGNPGATSTWTIDGIPGSTGLSQSVDTSTPGAFIYAVTVTDDLTGCTSQDSVTITVNTTPSFTTTATNTTACPNNDGSISFIGSSPGNDHTMTWTNATGNTITNLNSLFTGVYIGTITNNLTGCTQTIFETVDSNIGSPNVTATADTVCTNADQGTITLSGAVPTPYDYILINQEDLSSQSISGTTAMTITANAGTYSLEFQEQGTGCKTSLTNITIATITEPTLDVSFLSCSPNYVVEVTASEQGSFTLSGPESSSSLANVLTHQFTVTTNGSYTILFQPDSNPSCEFFEFFTIDTTSYNIIQTGTACDEEVTLSVSPNTGQLSYQWQLNSVDINNANTDFIVVNQSGNYTLQINDQTTGCTNAIGPSTVNVTNSPLEVGITASPSIACENETVTLTANITNANLSDVEYTWFGNSAPLGNDATQDIINANTYILSVTDTTTGCTVTDSIEIVKSNIIASATSTETICPDEPVNQSVTLIVTGESIVWTLPDGSQSFNNSILATEAGIYEVDITNATGCIGKEEIQVVEQCNALVVVPTAFRPESNITSNQTLNIFHRNVGNFKVMIFNRWGEKIYESEDPDFEWDGTINSEIQPGGYPFRIIYTDENDPNTEKLEERGVVRVLR